MIPRRHALLRLLCAGAPLAWLGPVRALGWRPAPDVGAARLVDQDGRTRPLADLLQTPRPVAVSFFYTGCATVCPPQTALLMASGQQWRARPALRGLLMLSISVDPLNDGPAKLRAYGQRHGLPLGESQGWLLLSGEAREVRRALAAFEVPERADAHPSLLWLGDPARGRWTRTSALNPPQLNGDLFEALRR
jgi:protein SCO1/2